MRSRVPYRLIAVVVVGAAASAAGSLLTACSSDGSTPKCTDTQIPVDASDPDATVLAGDCLYGPGYAYSEGGSAGSGGGTDAGAE
jgi:hypothetical protein